MIFIHHYVEFTLLVNYIIDIPFRFFPKQNTVKNFIVYEFNFILGREKYSALFKNL